MSFTCTLFSDKGRCFNQSERALYGNFIIKFYRQRYASWQWSKFFADSLGSASWVHKILTTVMTRIVVDKTLYNNPSYSRILIGSCLWSIRGQTHDWRHHYSVFASAVLKWRKVLRIRKIFYVTGQNIRYEKVLPRHWTGSRSQKAKDKAVSFRKWYRNNFLAGSVERD